MGAAQLEVDYLMVCFLALGFALQHVSYSLLSRQCSPTVPTPTPATSIDIPSVKTGKPSFIHSRLVSKSN